jgi:glutamyl-tRNA synthetase
MLFHKTRLAPTPSGFLHIGNVISFFITASLAKKHGAKVLLRIDDLDQQRSRNEYIQDIFDTIDFLDIPFDEGPRNISEFRQEYSQIHRLPSYQLIIEELTEKKLVFACDCSRKTLLKNHPKRWYKGTCLHRNLAPDKNQTALRLNSDENKEMHMHLYTDGLSACRLTESMKYFMVRKKDGFPSYQLASLADDINFGVDLIVRGMDLLPSSIAQVYLSHQLKDHSFSGNTFYHHQLFKTQGEKLSKSKGSYSIHQMRKTGMQKDAVYILAGKHLGLERLVNNFDEFSLEFSRKLDSEINHQSPE